MCFRKAALNLYVQLYWPENNEFIIDDKITSRNNTSHKRSCKLRDEITAICLARQTRYEFICFSHYTKLAERRYTRHVGWLQIDFWTIHFFSVLNYLNELMFRGAMLCWRCVYGELHYNQIISLAFVNLCNWMDVNSNSGRAQSVVYKTSIWTKLVILLKLWYKFICLRFMAGPVTGIMGALPFVFCFITFVRWGFWAHVLDIYAFIHI